MSDRSLLEDLEANDLACLGCGELVDLAGGVFSVFCSPACREAFMVGAAVLGEEEGEWTDD